MLPLILYLNISSLRTKSTEPLFNQNIITYKLYHLMRGTKLIPKVLNISRFSKDELLQTLQSQCSNVRLLIARVVNNIQSLKLTAASKGLVSLSTPCVDLNQAFFVIHEDPKENIWMDNYYKHGKFIQYINPEILEYSKETTQKTQKCPSFPLLNAVIKRSKKITVKYQNCQRQQKCVQIQGFHAAVFQHQMDHIRGISIIDWDRNMGRLQLDKQIVNQFPKVQALLIDYSQKMQKLIAEYKQISQPSQKQIPQISFYRDFVQRFMRHYQRQYTLYQARQALK